MRATAYRLLERDFICATAYRLLERDFICATAFGYLSGRVSEMRKITRPSQNEQQTFCDSKDVESDLFPAQPPIGCLIFPVMNTEDSCGLQRLVDVNEVLDISVRDTIEKMAV